MKQRIYNADGKGRLVLGSRHANQMFRVTEQPDGNLLLEPVVAIHEREAWLHKNPQALESVLRGMQESREGKGRSLDPGEEG